MGEGLTASVAVSDLPDGVRNYHNAGKVQASSDPADMRLQRMLGHLTTLTVENPRSILVIGCGAGITAGAVSVTRSSQRAVSAGRAACPIRLRYSTALGALALRSK